MSLVRIESPAISHESESNQSEENNRIENSMAGETGGERGEGLPPGPRNGKMMGGMGGNQPFIKRALFTDFAFLLPFLRGKLRVQWGPFRTGKGPLSAQRAL